MMKLLWIPIVLYLVALGVFITRATSRGTDEGIAAQILAGQGLALPVFFFAFLFIWFFNRRKKRQNHNDNI